MPTTTERDELVGMVCYFATRLESAELILTPSHHGLLPTPDAGAVPEVLRTAFSNEAEALAWCAANSGDIDRTARACAAWQMHQQVLELVHLYWPVFLRLGYPRMELLDLALMAALHLEDEPGIAMIQTGRCAPLRAEARYQESLEAAAEADAIYTRLGDARGRGQAANARGKTLRATGDFEGAWQAHQQARELRAEAGYTRGVGLSTFELSVVALDLGQVPTALELAVVAQRILLEELPEQGQAADEYDGARAMIGAARAHVRLGDTQAAIQLLATADASMHARGSDRGRGLAAEATGEVYETVRAVSDAVVAYRAALVYYASTDPAGVARVSRRIADLERAR